MSVCTLTQGNREVNDIENTRQEEVVWLASVCMVLEEETREAGHIKEKSQLH